MALEKPYFYAHSLGKLPLVIFWFVGLLSFIDKYLDEYLPFGCSLNKCKPIKLCIVDKISNGRLPKGGKLLYPTLAGSAKVSM